MKRTIVVTSLLLAFAEHAAANVHVTFKIGVPLMARRYADPDTVQTQIAAVLANELRRKLPQWTYAAAPPGPNDYTLAFEVQSKLGRHIFDLVLSKGAHDYEIADAVWLEPGELSLQNGYPDRNKVAQEVGSKVAEKLISKKWEAILTKMMIVPLATSGIWLNPRGRQEDLRMALPLEWPQSRVLVKSIVRIECGDATLRSEALDESVDYNDPPRPRFKALVVKPTVRIIGAEQISVRNVIGEVRALKPVAIFLESMDPLGWHLADDDPARGGQ